MAKVLGIGGVFFKSPDPKKLYDWYAKYLGMDVSDWGTMFTPQDMPKNSQTVWSAFDAQSDHFDPSTKEFMINLIVDDLKGALDQVKAGGAKIVGDVESMEYGSFAHFMDPDGNKIELWQPT